MFEPQKISLSCVDVYVHQILYLSKLQSDDNIPKGPVTRCNFSCNLSRNGVATQVARVIASFTVMPCNGQNLFAIQVA
jgi:hypothetical protein